MAFCVRGFGYPACPQLVDWVVKLRGVKAYANTQNARQATDTAFSSYMLKQGGKGPRVKWQQRWVVLKANGDILYYKDNKTNHPSGQLRLQGACVRDAFKSTEH